MKYIVYYGLIVINENPEGLSRKNKKKININYNFFNTSHESQQPVQFPSYTLPPPPNPLRDLLYFLD